jgi:hypothetical protein
MVPLLLAATAGQALLGGYQAATSGAGAAERELERQAKKSPLYKGSKSIDDYYQQALSRFQESPYQSQQYQIGAKNIQRATAQGLAASQDRRGGIGNAAKLAAIQAGSFGDLGMLAEAQKNQRFGQLGSATQMKTGEDYRKFDINQMAPYQRNLQLAQMKSQAANERRNAGLQMIGGAASNLAMGGMIGGAGSGAETGLSNRLVNKKIAQGEAAQGLLSNFMSNRPEINQAYAPFSMKKPDFSAYQLPKYTPKTFY